MAYKDYPTTNKKLGMTYSKEKTIFRVYSPMRARVQLLLYPHMYHIKRDIYDMVKDDDGVYKISIEGDLKGYYYTYLVEGKYEVTDPYSISSSLNSNRSAIIDLRDTDPKGFRDHKIPDIDNKDAIIYEVHIKDFTIHESSKVKDRGKFLGFIEKIPHLKDLGITHIHLMPVYDFLTVDEEEDYFFSDHNYNWGYDPELYNNLEGSYSSNPQDPNNRIYEFKQLVQAIHDAGLKVVLDVVYNHTYRTKDSNFNILVDKYYYRQYKDGRFANGSGCGNELATERPMVRKFIMDSLKYWVEEFKVDGFRFDLMALMDIDTVEYLIEKLRQIRPDILIYGEPWTAGQTPLSDKKTTSKGTQSKLGFALFNNDYRDFVKGDNDGKTPGFIQGNLDYKAGTESGITGSIYYDDSHMGFTKRPQETINYLNSHDNLILADKIANVFEGIDNKGNKRLNKLAHAILFTSQGIPFIHGGNEFLRSKHMISNSYNSPSWINAIDWNLKDIHNDLYEYIRDLIKLRKSYDSFKMTQRNDIRNRLKFIEVDGNTILYTIKDERGYLLIGHNGNMSKTIISKSIISKHIEKNYSDKLSHMDLYRVLDGQGLRDKEEIHQLNCIGIDYFSSVVFRIK